MKQSEDSVRGHSTAALLDGLGNGTPEEGLGQVREVLDGLTGQWNKLLIENAKLRSKVWAHCGIPKRTVRWQLEATVRFTCIRIG